MRTYNYFDTIVKTFIVIDSNNLFVRYVDKLLLRSILNHDRLPGTYGSVSIKRILKHFFKLSILHS